MKHHHKFPWITVSKTALIMLVFTGLISVQITNAESTQSSIIDTNSLLLWLVQHGSSCPKEVLVTNTVQATIVNSNFVEIGTFRVTNGTKAEIAEFNPEKMIVKVGYFTLKIPTSATDIIYRINTNAEASKINSSVSVEGLTDVDFSTPEKISESFAKDPKKSQAFLEAREINVSGRVFELEIQDPSSFIMRLIMTTGLKPRVVFTDDVKKSYGLDLEKYCPKNINPEDVIKTWKIAGKELLLHMEWSVKDTDSRYDYHYDNYTPMKIMRKDSDVTGIGKEEIRTVRFLKSDPNAVYFEIIR